MIGVYNYTVILTFMSLASAILGMTSATGGHFRMAMLFLALSGLFDMFDGKVARRKKDRTDDEKLFGIQLDSLCDVVAFGAMPVVFCFTYGMRSSLGILILMFYCICGVIRLAHFNVLETNQFFSDEVPTEKVYHGLPITSISIILPLFFLTNYILPTKVFYLLLHIAIFVTGFLFITDFKIKKPNNKILAIIVVVVGAAVILTLFYARYHVMKCGGM